MSTEATSQTPLRQVTRLMGDVLSFQVSQMTAFFGAWSRWNALMGEPSEHAARELHKLTKETFAYTSELQAEARKSHQATTKRGLAVFGMFA